MIYTGRGNGRYEGIYLDPIKPIVKSLQQVDLGHFEKPFKAFEN